MTKATTITLRQMRDWISARAAGAVAPVPCHWVHGANEFHGIGCDEGTDYCLPCCEQKVAEIKRRHRSKARRIGVCVDGGWGTEHDSPPFCDGCGAKLIGFLTDYGIEQELEHFESYPPEGDEDWDAIDVAMVNVRAQDMTLEQLQALPLPTDDLDRCIHETHVRIWTVIAPYVLAAMQEAT